MATQTKPTTTTDKPARKAAPSLLDRTKAQWSTATLKAKVTPADIEAMAAHLTKLKSLLS